jgi:hypothetical protein
VLDLLFCLADAIVEAGAGGSDSRRPLLTSGVFDESVLP